jgi:hypothetical protein
VRVLHVDLTHHLEQSGDEWKVSVNRDNTLRCRFSENLDFQVVIPDLCGDGPAYDCVVLSDKVLWLGAASYSLAVIDREGQLTLIALYRRARTDSAIFRQKFLEIEGRPLLIYEGGLIRFSTDGRQLWRINHDRMDWYFKEATDGKLWYESDHEGVWAYRLEDGLKVS